MVYYLLIYFILARRYHEKITPLGIGHRRNEERHRWSYPQPCHPSRSYPRPRRLSKLSSPPLKLPLTRLPTQAILAPAAC